MKKIVHFNEEQVLFVYKITKFVSHTKDSKENKQDFSKGNFNKEDEIQIENANGNWDPNGDGVEDKFSSEELSYGDKNEEFLKLKDSDSFNKEKSKGFKGKNILISYLHIFHYLFLYFIKYNKKYFILIYKIVIRYFLQ
jgi:hypothetical protein